MPGAKKKTLLQEQRERATERERIRLHLKGLGINLPAPKETAEERADRMARRYGDCYSAH